MMQTVQYVPVARSWKLVNSTNIVYGLLDNPNVTTILTLFVNYHGVGRQVRMQFFNVPC